MERFEPSTLPSPSAYQHHFTIRPHQQQHQQQHEYVNATGLTRSHSRHGASSNSSPSSAANTPPPPPTQEQQPPPPNSMRALMATRHRNGGLIERHHNHQQQQHPHHLHPPHLQHFYGTHENIYEEISEAAAAERHRLLGAGHSMVSLTPTTVEEEFRRVHTRHRRVLGELNLSVEAMLMPQTPPSGDDDDDGDGDEHEAHGRGALASGGVEVDIDDCVDDDVAAALDIELAERLSKSMAAATAAAKAAGGGGSGSGVGGGGELLSPSSGHHVALGQSGAGDMDSGFSGSSSGASCMGSLRYRTASGTVRCTTPNGGAAVMFGSVIHGAAGGGGGNGASGNSARSSQRSTTAQHQHLLMGGGSSAASTGSGAGADAGHPGAVMLMMTTAARSVSACGNVTAGALTSSAALFGRACEDPGPSTGSGGRGEKKASFWSRKGWRKLSASFSSSGSVHKAGLLSGKCRGSCDDCRKYEIKSIF